MQGVHTYVSSYPQPLAPTMATIMDSSNMIHSLRKKPAHRRRDSGELDVFDATRYFSGGMDVATVCPNLLLKEGSIANSSEMGSLESMPMRSISPPSSKPKKCKMPNSPRARLASFLNSFFHQTTSRKSKLKNEEVEIRSHVSHSHPLTRCDSRSIYSYSNSSSTSGFKTYKRSFQSEIWEDKKVIDGCLERAAMLRGSGHGVVENRWVLNKPKDGFLKRDRIWVIGMATMGRRRKSFRGGEEMEEDGASDCSSDLFELKNYDMGGLSSMEVVKRERPLSSLLV